MVLVVRVSRKMMRPRMILKTPMVMRRKGEMRERLPPIEKRRNRKMVAVPMERPAMME